MAVTDFLETVQTGGGGSYISLGKASKGDVFDGILDREPFTRNQSYEGKDKAPDRNGNIPQELVLDYLPIGGNPESDLKRIVLKAWTLTPFVDAWKEAGSPVIGAGDYVKFVYGGRFKNKTGGNTHFEWSEVVYQPASGKPTADAHPLAQEAPVSDETARLEDEARKAKAAAKEAARKLLMDDDEPPF